MPTNNIPTAAQILELSRERHDIAITLVIPTETVGDNTAARIHARTLFRGALAQLKDAEKRRIWPIEDDLSAILEEEEFWAHQSRGLVLLLTPERARSFQIPSTVRPGAHVSDRFHLKPLMRSLTARDSAHVLALEEDQVRLFHVTGAGIEEIRTPQMPGSAAALAGKASINGRSPSGRFQGQEGQRLRLAQFARRVDQVLGDVLHGSTEPVILHAAEPLLSIFRNVTTLPTFAGHAIEGSPKAVPETEIEAQARGILDRIRADDLTAFQERFALREGQGRALTQTDLVARAATAGAVETLLIDMDAAIPGTVCETTGQITFAAAEGADSYGIVDEIAARVLRTGGQVIAVRKAEMPEGQDVAATLRWSF